MSEIPDRGEIEASMEQMVEQGLMEHVGLGEDGEVHYRLTEAGRQHARDLILADDFVCPVHEIRDCSPLLNGCDIMTKLKRSASS